MQIRERAIGAVKLMEKIIVLGIGNILMQDDGFGVRVIEELGRRLRFPDNVELLDGGTLGFELLSFITGADKLLVVDAINGGGLPGTFYRFAGDEVQAYFQEKVSLHELGIKDVLAVLEMQGENIGEIVVLGVQPESIELGLELTPGVAKTIDKVVAAVITELTRWRVGVTKQA
ncbi:MAG: hybD 1 [Firmicutes bacterium]|nr:hybD 1 [Bacillota bacterium]